MNAASLPRNVLLPQPPRGKVKGFVLALLVHLALVAALAFAVNWHASEPAGVQAELWAAVPQTAAAAPRLQPAVERPKPTPPPPPKVQDTKPDAQIAIEQKKREERERKLKQEAEQKQQQLEKEKTAQAEQKLKQKEEAERIEKLRQQNLQRILGQAGADATSTGNASRTAGPSATYMGRVIARIRPNIVFAGDVPGNPRAEVEVHVGPDGTILSVKPSKSSGFKEWDDAVIRALERTQMLPRDTDGTVPSTMLIGLRPRDVNP